MALNDVYGVRTQFRDHGRIWTVNQYYRDDTGVVETEAANDLVDAVDATLGPLFDACRATDSTREGSYGWKIEAGTGMPAKNSENSTAGTSGQATSTSPNNCAVLTLRTTDPSAVRSGRLYMAGLPGAWIETGRWNAAAMTALVNLADAIQTPLAGALGSWVPVILRRVSAGVPLVPPVASDVFQVTVTNVIYSQRKRTSRQLGSG